MGASSEIRFKIGADTSALSRGFAQAESVAATAGRALHKKLGLQDAFKSTVLALGLSVEKISEKIAELFTGGAQEAWKSALESANESAKIIEESTLARLSTLRQIAELEKNIKRNAANENAAPKTETVTTKGQFIPGGIGGGVFVPGTTTTTRAVETPAEALARAQKATAARLANEARIAALKEKSEKNTERIAEARRELDRVGATDQEQFNSLLEDAGRIGDRMLDARKKGADTTELELSFLAKMKQAKENILKREKDITKEIEDRGKEIAKLQEDEDDGIDTLLQKSISLHDAQHNALGFTVGAAAKGERGTPSDRALAKRIQSDEGTARRLFDTGNSVTQFDFKTGRNVKRDAKFFQNRAAQLREGFGKLTTDEQKPFAAAEKELHDANAHLEKIEASLAEVKLK